MKSVLFVLFFLMLGANSHAVTLADGDAEKGLKTFFVKSQANLSADEMDCFVEKYRAQVKALSLTKCHAVYQLLGVLAVQLERPFRDIAVRLLESYTSNKEMIFEWTGYRWSEKPTQGKDAEVVQSLYLISNLRGDKRDADALQRLYEHGKACDTFFACSVVAACGGDWPELTAQTWMSFVGKQADAREGKLFCLSYVLLQRSCLARMLYLRRYDQAENYMSQNEGALRANQQELGFIYMMCEFDDRALLWSSTLLTDKFIDIFKGEKDKDFQSKMDRFLSDAVVGVYLQRITGHRGG